MRVLVVKLSSMGDLVQTLPALSDAVRSLPEVTFDWVVDEAFAEIPCWHPQVDRVIKTAHRRWRTTILRSLRSGEIKHFLSELRRYHYDAVVDVQTNLKSALVTALAHGEKHGPDRLSVREYPAHWAYKVRHSVTRDQLAIERIRQLFAASLGYAVPTSPPDFAVDGKAWPAVTGLPDQPFLVAVVNASWDNKYWIDDYWRDVITLAGQQGYQVLLPWGSAGELQRTQAIAEGLDNARVLPRYSLSELAGILRQSQGCLSVDTGLAHIAAALDVPTVTVYGPTDPRLIGATGRNSRHLTASGYACVPCYRRTCSVAGYQGPEGQCFKNITPDRVWQAFLAAMAPLRHAEILS